MSDATLTQTNKDFFTGASFAIPVGLLLGGSYFWLKHGTAGKKNAPDAVHVETVLALSAAAAGAVLIYRSWRRSHPT